MIFSCHLIPLHPYSKHAVSEGGREGGEKGGGREGGREEEGREEGGKEGGREVRSTGEMVYEYGLPRGQRSPSLHRVHTVRTLQKSM